jgi:hypothetical protein
VLALVVRAHRAAHHDDRGVVAPVGQLAAVVEQHPVQRDAALAELVLVHARRLAAGVLQHEDRVTGAHRGAA